MSRPAGRLRVTRRVVARIGELVTGTERHRRTAPLLSDICRALQGQCRSRHHIPKQRYRVTNWSEYDAALRQRGSLTVWFTDDAIAAWRAEPRTTRGGQAHYSALAIRTALTLRAVFRLALRQTEGLIGPILQLLGLDLAVSDHSTLSRRAETLEVPKHRRAWTHGLAEEVRVHATSLGGNIHESPQTSDGRRLTLADRSKPQDRGRHSNSRPQPHA